MVRFKLDSPTRGVAAVLVLAGLGYAILSWSPDPVEPTPKAEPEVVPPEALSETSWGSTESPTIASTSPSESLDEADLPAEIRELREVREKQRKRAEELRDRLQNIEMAIGVVREER